MSLGARDPRNRRNADALTTDDELGAGLKRDENGRQTLDALSLSPEVYDAIEAEMLRRGFVKQ